MQGFTADAAGKQMAREILQHCRWTKGFHSKVENIQVGGLYSLPTL